MDEITSLAQLETLAPEWQQLWERCPRATPFQTPAWLLAWWRHLGHGRLWSLAYRREGRLAALAPLFVYTDADGCRRLLFLGTSISDYLDLLADPAGEADACQVIWDYLRQRSGEWDLVDWQELSECSTGRRHAPAEAVLEPCAECPVVALPSTAEAFLDGLPSGLRRNVRRYREQLERTGTITFETAGDCSVLLAEFFRLHAERWAVSGEGGMVADGRMRRFHDDAARGLAACGLLRLHALRLNGEVAAVVYSFLAKGRAYSYLGGFSPDLAKFSPGTLILRYSMEQSILEGASEWDFLRGREPYKYQWGAVDRINVRCVCQQH